VSRCSVTIGGRFGNGRGIARSGMWGNTYLFGRAQGCRWLDDALLEALMSGRTRYRGRRNEKGVRDDQLGKEGLAREVAYVVVDFLPNGARSESVQLIRRPLNLEPGCTGRWADRRRNEASPRTQPVRKTSPHPRNVRFVRSTPRSSLPATPDPSEPFLTTLATTKRHAYVYSR
jgi:hypothetical protein